MDLTPTGVAQAQQAGQLLKEAGYDFDIAYTSVLKRAVWTLWYALEEMSRTWLPVRHSWRLNERHYGALQGLNKADMAKQYGDEQVLIWRRSYDTRRPPSKPPTPLRAQRPPLQRLQRRSPADRMPEGHRRPRAALLERDHRPVDQVRPARPHRRPRQQYPRPGQYLDNIADDAIVGVNIPTASRSSTSSTPT